MIEVCLALGVIAFSPAATQASDYGPMVRDALAMLAVAGGAAVLLGAGTAAILARTLRHKLIWLLTPVFALIWAALLLGAHELYLNISAAPTTYEHPAAVPKPAPETGRPPVASPQPGD